MAVVWTDHTIFDSSKPNSKTGLKQSWKVQVNEAGQFRCNCPSFIFSKNVPKTCKHCRNCEENEAAKPVAVSPAARKPTQPAVAEATKMFGEMCAAATKVAKFNVGNQLGHAAMTAMIEVLSQRLAIYVAPTQPATVEVIGVRRITFDD